MATTPISTTLTTNSQTVNVVGSKNLESSTSIDSITGNSSTSTSITNETMHTAIDIAVKEEADERKEAITDLSTRLTKLEEIQHSMYGAKIINLMDYARDDDHHSWFSRAAKAASAYIGTNGDGTGHVVLYIPAGKYNLQGEIRFGLTTAEAVAAGRLPGKFTICGEGVSTQIHIVDNIANISSNTKTYFGIRLGNLDTIAVKDLVITGDSIATTKTFYTLDLFNCSCAYIQNVVFQNCNGNALRIYDDTSNDSGEYLSIYAFINNCTFIGTANKGIILGNTLYSLITNNIIRDCSNYAIHTVSSDNCIIANNFIMFNGENTNKTILIETANGVNINNNIINESFGISNDSIYLKKCTNSTVSNNQISFTLSPTTSEISSGTSAIYLNSTCNGAVINGNIVENCITGMNVESGALNYTIENNYFRNVTNNGAITYRPYARHEIWYKLEKQSNGTMSGSFPDSEEVLTADYDGYACFRYDQETSTQTKGWRGIKNITSDIRDTEWLSEVQEHAGHYSIPVKKDDKIAVVYPTRANDMFKLLTLTKVR